MKNTRKIDNKAQKVFKNILPDDWLVRDRIPDIYVDYAVEIADLEPSGEIFLVQLKGTEKPRYKGRKAKVRLKTKHLVYYLKKLKLPLFVVLVDNKAEKAFWVFIQRWLKEHQDINLESENSVDVDIPLENDLANTSKLISSVKSAEKFMRELWPSSIHASIQNDKQLYEQIDDRFTADVSYLNGKTSYTFRAKEPVDIFLGLGLSADSRSKLFDVFERGRPAIFTTNEITSITGSPLFEHLQESGKLTELIIKPDTKLDAQLNLSVADTRDSDIVNFYGINGVIYGGRTEASFEGAVPKTPLSIRISFPLVVPHNLQCSVNILYDSSRWDSHQILSLPYFDKLCQFYQAINQGSKIRIACEVEGQQLFTSSSVHNAPKGILGLAVEHLRVVEMVRTIFRRYGKNAEYPKGGFIDNAEIRTIELLHALITDGSLRLKGKGVCFKGKLRLKEGFLEFSELLSKAICLQTEPDSRFSILGQEIEAGSVSYTLTYPNFSPDIRNLSSLEIENELIFEITGTNESQLIIAKA